MDYFERMPWLLIPVIIITMEVWTALKNLVRRSLMGHKETVRD
jgi:hypothetical protein